MAAEDNITGSGSGNGSSSNDDHAPPPPQQLAVARGRRRAEPPMRLSALYLMLFGATVIVGAAGVGRRDAAATAVRGARGLARRLPLAARPAPAAVTTWPVASAGATPAGRARIPIARYWLSIDRSFPRYTHDHSISYVSRAVRYRTFKERTMGRTSGRCCTIR